MLSLGLTYYLCLLIELLYPTYASFKAIQSSDKYDDTQWLTYWVVYAFISTAESVGEFILDWVPLYYEMKLAFFLWMMVPQTQGARVIYERFIVPQLVKYGPKIDPIFNRTEEVLKSNTAARMAQMIEKHGPAVAEQALKQAAGQAAKLQQAAATHIQQQAAAAQNRPKDM